MMNALRLTGGFDMETFGARTGLDWSSIATPVEALRARGLVAVEGSLCKPTPLGLRFLNEVLLEFLPENAVLAGKRVMSTGS
jgi:oxygen-independent coproporphyrinogen-3 oxidase